MAEASVRYGYRHKTHLTMVRQFARLISHKVFQVLVEIKEIVGAVVNDGVVGGRITEEEGGDVETGMVMGGVEGLAALMGDVLPDRVVVNHEGETTAVEDHVGFGAILQVFALAIAFVAREEEEAIVAEAAQVADTVEANDGEQQSGVREVVPVVMQDVVIGGISVVVGGDGAIGVGDGEVINQVRVIEV
ncbi:MAG: hypothetical protein ACKO24_03920 [Leptolyngbyaceae cyanobacterium]